MWPCRDTMKHISHLSYSPLQGLALVSGGYHGALMYPRLASLTSLEIIHLSTLPKLLGRGPVNTNHIVVFCVAGAFLTPVGAVNCLFMSEVGVSNQTKHPRAWTPSKTGTQNEGQFVLLLLDTIHTVLDWLDRIWRAMLHNMFPPATLPVHRTRYTFERISAVWLSPLIIGRSRRSVPERGSPTCETKRLGQPLPGSLRLPREAGSAAG